MIIGTLENTGSRGGDRARRGAHGGPIHRARLPLWCIILPVLMLGAECGSPSSPGEDDSDFDEDVCLLPAFSAASITLDGQVGDWDGITPLAVGAQGDDSPELTGDDLRAVYVAQSSEDLFVRVDLWESVNTNFGNGPIDEEWGRYAVEIDNVGPFPEMSIGVAFDVDRGEWSAGHNGGSTGVPSGLEGPTFVAVVGSVIEFGVPLSLIGNPSGFTEVWGLALTTIADTLDIVGQACVPG